MRKDLPNPPPEQFLVFYRGAGCGLATWLGVAGAIISILLKLALHFW